MVYRKFGFRISVYVATIAALSTGAAFCYLHCLFLTATCLTIILIVACALLVHYVQRTNRELSRLLLAVKHNDFSQHFSTAGNSSSVNELHQSFNEILDAFRKMRLEKEEQFLYLQTVIEHISVSMLAFDDNGRIELYNNAAKETIGIPYLRAVSDINRLHPQLLESLKAIKPGEQQLIKLNEDSTPKVLSLRVEDFIINKRNIRLASLQDIRSELEQKELETWQKMIRVLTHEIMNSVTPITSLASATIGFMEENGVVKQNSQLSNENIEDTLSGLYTIRKRSEALTNFIQRYRALMRVPQPRLQTIKVKDLYARVIQLMQQEYRQHNVSIAMQQIPEQMTVNADPELLEQVLINIMKNAMQATQHSTIPTVTLGADYSDTETGKIILRISDNGIGISDEVKDKIFIPFFTTKENGSGIGLSLSQQIIRAHNGSINIHSKEGEGTQVMTTI